ENYDEGLFKLVDEVYKQSKFRYVRYDSRKPDTDKGGPEKTDNGARGHGCRPESWGEPALVRTLVAITPGQRSIRAPAQGRFAFAVRLSKWGEEVRPARSLPNGCDLCIY